MLTRTAARRITDVFAHKMRPFWTTMAGCARCGSSAGVGVCRGNWGQLKKLFATRGKLDLRVERDRAAYAEKARLRCRRFSLCSQKPLSPQGKSTAYDSITAAIGIDPLAYVPPQFDPKRPFIARQAVYSDVRPRPYPIGAFPSRLASCHLIAVLHSSVLSSCSQAVPTWARCARQHRSNRRNRRRSLIRPYPPHRRRHPLICRACRPAADVSRSIRT